MPPTPAPPSGRPTAAADTRPASLWPDSIQGLDSALAQDAVTHFDPLTDPPADGSDPRAAGLAVCEPALGLRVLLAVLAAVLLASLAGAGGAGLWWAQAPGLAVAALGGGLLWLSLVCLGRQVLARLGAPVASALAGLAGALAAVVGWGLLVLLGVADGRPWPAFSAALCGAALAVAVWHWLGLRAAAGRPAEASARLAELQSRIRPHFLFNALNTALALVQVDPPRAEGVLEDLSALFRVALAETGSAVSLDDEVDLAQRYLAIEQIRFGARLALAWDLDPAAATARLPPLVLQPLVENAVRHGVEPSPRGGTVRVRSRVLRGMVQLEVINSLPAEPGPPGSGLALANVRERLRLLHDLAGRLHTEQRDGHFIARIEVPL